MAHFSNLRESSSVEQPGRKFQMNATQHAKTANGKAVEELDVLGVGAGFGEGADEMNTPVVLITGELTGIARAAALAFAKEGNGLLVPARHQGGGHGLVRGLMAP